MSNGAIDDSRVCRTAPSAAGVASVATGRTPTPLGLTQNAFDVRTPTGTAPALPATAATAFCDGRDRVVGIQWDQVDPTEYAARGAFTASGTAAGHTVTAHVTVFTEGDLVVDLAQDTGTFHGGASGTLYGVYGPGLPTNNLIEGMNLRTVSTKAQDGPQHPGADALEVVGPLADSTGGDVFIYMTDTYRGFPYQWPGSTPAEKLDGFMAKIAVQVDQVLALDPCYQDNIVFVPFNEPEGNTFGTGTWSYDGTSWLDDPKDYFAAWDEVYALIKGKMAQARIAGPNTSVLYDQVKGYLEHVSGAHTVPDVMTWHELSDPASIRTSVATYRRWEKDVFAGTSHEGRSLPININEYAHNYHTSVPGQMIQWICAIEESKVDADIAYWNIDGNLSDSAVQANRGNGQWWLFNAYGAMTGHTVAVAPPRPGTNYTMQAVATLDESKAQARALFGGSRGAGHIQFDNVPVQVLGTTVHALIREIAWTGQVGDSGQPKVVAELNAPIRDGSVAFDFGSQLPALTESSAYEIILTPGRNATSPAVAPNLWESTYEAEDATYTGSGYSRNGPEGSPADVSKFYTSGGFHVGGLRTGSDGVLDFAVDVPQDGTYDLSVFANSLNSDSLVQPQGPTNVFLRVDGAAEQEQFLPLAYKWVVWDHADTTVALTAGRHVISLAARSLDGTRVTRGDALIDKIDLSLANPAARSIYEAELASLNGARADYTHHGVSGSGVAAVAKGDSVTFWVYSAKDAEATLAVDAFGGGQAQLAVNGRDIARIGTSLSVQVFLSGGVNKVTVTGLSGTLFVDRLVVEQDTATHAPTIYEAEDGVLDGAAQVTPLSLASGGSAVTAVGGKPGNANTLTFRVSVDRPGTYATTVRYSNPEQSPATHYNPDPLARHADIAVNAAAPQRVAFPHTFSENNFWDLTVPLELVAGQNTITFSASELPNFDGTTYACDTFPGMLLRSQLAPAIDNISVARFSSVASPSPVGPAR